MTTERPSTKLRRLAREIREVETTVASIFPDEEVTMSGWPTPPKEDDHVVTKVSRPIIVLITSWKNEYLRLAVIALIIAGLLGAYFLYKIEVAAPTSVNVRPSKSPAAGSSSVQQPQP